MGRAIRQQKQRDRDRRAREVADENERRIADVMSNQALSHFILYLRPFALERKFRFRRSLPFSAGALIEPGTASFEQDQYRNAL